MPISDILSSPEGSQFIAGLATNLGVRPAQAEAAAAILLPVLAKGISLNTLSRGGVADLLGALSSGHHAAVITDPTSLTSEATLSDGQKILGHVLGSSAQTAAVAQAAAATGLSGAILGKMLPVLAVFLLGYLFRNGKGAIADAIQKGTEGGGFSLPGGFNLPGGLNLPGGGGTSGGGGSGSSPLPVPDLDKIGRRSSPDDNPYGDLSKTIRNGGPGAGDLTSIIRDVLGGLLGFQSKGFLGWILRFLVFRYGWSILSALLRGFLRRA